MSHYTADVQVMHLYETRPIQRDIKMVCKWSHKSLLHLQCVASVNACFICSSQWLQQYSLIWKAIMCFKWMNYSVPEPPRLTSLFKCAWPAISFQSKTKGAELPGEQWTVGSGGRDDVRTLFSWPTWINPIRHWVVLEDATPHVNRSFITQVSWCLNEWINEEWMNEWKKFTSKGNKCQWYASLKCWRHSAHLKIRYVKTGCHRLLGQTENIWSVWSDASTLQDAAIKEWLTPSHAQQDDHH